MPLPITGIGPSQGLTDLYNLSGKLPMVLDTTIVPVVNIGDLNEEVTWGPLCYGALQIDAAAGVNTCKAEIALPYTSQIQGLKAHIERVWLIDGAVSWVWFRPSPGIAAPTHFGVKSFADTRHRGTPQLVLSGANNTPAVGTTGSLALQLMANVVTPYDVSWIIGPNPETGLQQGIMIEADALVSYFTVNVAWREGAPR